MTFPHRFPYRKREAAMLLAQGWTYADVCRQARVSRSTLLRWRRSPDFAAFVEVCAAPCPGTGIPGWLLTMLQGATIPVVWVLKDLIKHGDKKALALTLDTLQRTAPPAVPKGDHLPADTPPAQTAATPSPQPFPEPSRRGGEGQGWGDSSSAAASPQGAELTAWLRALPLDTRQQLADLLLDLPDQAADLLSPAAKQAAGDPPATQNDPSLTQS